SDVHPRDQEAVLSLKARLDLPTVGGYTLALKVTLNGTALDATRLINKPRHGKSSDGRIHSLTGGERFSTYYAPDFTSADQSNYGIAGVKTSEFEFRVTDLLRPGDNELVRANAADASTSQPLVVADGQLAFRP